MKIFEIIFEIIGKNLWEWIKNGWRKKNEGDNSKGFKMKDKITVITANAAGGAREENANPQFLGQIIAKEKPDIVGIQEAVVCWDGNNKIVDSIEMLNKEMDTPYQCFFSPTLDSQIHSHPGKWSSSRFKNFSHSQEGDGFLISKKYQIMDFWSDRPGQPIAITITTPSLFLGNRDTGPRQIIIARLKDNQQKYEFYFAITHLTTLKMEKRGNVEEGNSKITRQASKNRRKQIEHILYIMGQLPTEAPIILVGDFNATLNSPEMKILQKKFFSVTKLQSKMGEFTHIRHKIFIDHIFFFPKRCLDKDTCYLLDPKNASDHKPVVAKLEIKF